jgi:hypothetical protein
MKFIITSLIIIFIAVLVIWGSIWICLMLYGLIIQTIMQAWDFVAKQREQLKSFRKAMKEKKESKDVAKT